ncbi:ribonuclease-3 [Methanomicrobium sp. W14]|uniref:ribonuclease III domain-containing protein n=1 Tax=Methanomicrobium sp. W14 TaxID=2817839 RepID=UPI001AE8987D|nr:ribonuclease III domain-containing protein [Methanomicrobium sp. W14]MBP2132741.1 ribonuclease-3 [Methanomicrobium sp. W14]
MTESRLVYNSDADDLERKICYKFRNRNLLLRALTRHAYAKENSLKDSDYMDAYATLGDAVIDVVAISYLINEGEHEKGVISAKKADLVNMSSLRSLAESMELEKYVLWGKGEQRQHIWTSGRVLAECVESISGALYIDGGIDSVREFLEGTGFFSVKKY